MKSAARPDIRIYPDIVSLSRAACELIVSSARQSPPGAIFSVALSGGSTPKLLYTFLASSPYRDAVAWQRVHLFWADERCVPQNHSESNYRIVSDTLLSGVHLPASNIHRIPGEDGPGKAAEAYEHELRTFFGEEALPVFDLVILGAGTDGHTASIFPGSPAGLEKTRLAMPVYLDPPGYSRVTLTLQVLRNARLVLFLVAGRPKARVVHEILEHGNVRQYPAGMVQPVHGNLLWMLDREAASALTSPESGTVD